MSNTLTSTVVTQLTTGFQTIYTVPGSTTFSLSQMHFCNTTNAPVTVRVCIVPSAGSPAQANAILWDYSIAANDILEIMKGDVWTTGVTCQALAGGGSAINMKVSGIQTA